MDPSTAARAAPVAATATVAVPAALLSAEDLAQYFGVPLATVYAWNSRGTGPRRVRVGRHVRYRTSDVERWLDAHVAGDGAPAA